MKLFTVFWKDGKREVLSGEDFYEALASANYDQYMMSSVVLYVEGDNNDFEWVPDVRPDGRTSTHGRWTMRRK